MIKTVSVYMGAAEGRNPSYKTMATALGCSLMKNGINIVYGGADIGLMKAMADEFISARSHKESPTIIGVFPEGFKGRSELNKKHFEMESNTVDKIIHAKNFGERIAKMDELSDACIVFPGGFGTLQEMFSYLVNQQIGTHSKPVVIFNYGGYYNLLLEFFKQMEAEDFVHITPGRLYVAETIEEICKTLKSL